MPTRRAPDAGARKGKGTPSRGAPSRARATAAPLVLASSSPRRRSLLAEAGYRFTAVEPAADEAAAGRGGPPEEEALLCALAKARSVAAGLERGIVIGADTIVVKGSRVFGKPSDRADARRILGELSGTTHRVVTGLALVDARTGLELTRAESTEIEMAAMSAAEIQDYVASGESDGKAGAYAIQETADRFVRAVRGSLTNVVGLPMEALAEMLTQMKEKLNAGEDGR